MPKLTVRPGETLNTRFCRILLQQTLLDLTGRELAHYRRVKETPGAVTWLPIRYFAQ